jgi:hypothetical protein
VSPTYGPQQTPPQDSPAYVAHGGSGQAHIPLVQVHVPQIPGHCMPSTLHARSWVQFGDGPESPPPSEPLLPDELPEPLPEPDPPLDDDEDVPSAIDASAAVLVPFEPPQLTTKARNGSPRTTTGLSTADDWTSWPGWTQRAPPARHGAPSCSRPSATRPTRTTGS